ncbi:zf-HC2 domain-containing protein [Candidatus Fermentibacteria bacterium]|nr:zf-HC2 domain-containing protein [Candidatus Fermentibacteria bacterium]
MTCDAASVLLSGLLDGQLTVEQREELLAHLDHCPRCSRELAELRHLEGLMKRVSLPRLSDEAWDAHWNQLYNRLERSAGYVVAGLGAILLLCYGAWELCRDWLSRADVPLVLRGGCTLLALGFIVLTVSTVREKMLTYRYDRYKEIRR